MKRVNMRKMNNKGFSLLEVLIAVIILMIISVPFFRAFAVSAQTNANAKLMTKATTAAENVMEDFSALPIDKIIAKYGYGVDGSALVDGEGNNLFEEEGLTKEQQKVDDEGNLLTDAEGNPLLEEVAIPGYDNQKKYSFRIVDNALMDANLPDGYYAKATLDPTSFKNNNGLNVADYEAVSVKDSAIYTMDPDYDQMAYEYFNDKNDAAVASGAYIDVDEAFFAKNLKREILVEITNPDPTYEGEDGSTLAKVKLTITYSLAANDYVKPADKKYVQTEAFLYDNTANKKALNGVFLFFYPRYATAAAGGGKDSIIIDNRSNTKCNVYVTALTGPANVVEKSQYDSMKNALTIDVIEDYNASMEAAATTLRTNMLNRDSSTTLRTPYSKADAEISTRQYGLAHTVRYNYTFTGQKTTEDEVTAFLNIGDIDGKSLSTNGIEARIYKLTVDIYYDHGTPDDTDDDGEPILSLDGTKLP